MTILTYGGMLVALLLSFGILIVAFVPGLTVVAQEEVRSAGIFVTALTVIVIEVINTEDQLH